MSAFEVEYNGSERAEYDFLRATQNLDNFRTQGMHVALDRLSAVNTYRIEQADNLDRPPTIEQFDPLVPRIQRSAQDVFNSLRPFKQYGHTSEEALHTVWENITESMQRENNQHFDAFRHAMGKARFLSPALSPTYTDARTGWGPEWDVTRAVGWEIVRHNHAYFPFTGENPYLKLLELMNYGADRLQFRSVRRGDQAMTERIMADFEMALSKPRDAQEEFLSFGGLLVACLSFGDGAQQDSSDLRVGNYHAWGLDCSERELIPNSDRITVLPIKS